MKHIVQGSESAIMLPRMDSITSGGFAGWLFDRGLSVNTSRQTVSYVSMWLKSADTDDPQSLYDFLAKRRKSGCSNATINKIIQSVRRFCEYQNLTHIKIPKQLREDSRVRKTFSDDEIDQFLAIDPSSEWTDFFTVLAFTGCRPGELLHISTDCFDSLTRTLEIKNTKTHNDRIIPLSDRAFEALNSRVIHNKKIFCYSHTAMLKEFRKRCDLLGFNNRVPYSFRHSLATRLLDQDVNLFAVQDILGHSSAKTTAIYYHSNLKKLRSVIESDTLNRKNMKPASVFEQLLTLIKSFLKNDDRFNLEIDQKEDEVVIRIKRKLTKPKK